MKEQKDRGVWFGRKILITFASYYDKKCIKNMHTRQQAKRANPRAVFGAHNKKGRGWGLEGFFKHGLPPATTKGCIQSCNAILMKTIENLFQS